MSFQNRRPHHRHNNNNKNRRRPAGHGHAHQQQDDFQGTLEYTTEVVKQVSLSSLMKQKKVPQKILDLQLQKEKMLPKMTAIKNRLTFGYSEPLNDEYMKLVEQDLEVSCQLNELLLALSSAS